MPLFNYYEEYLFPFRPCSLDSCRCIYYIGSLFKPEMCGCLVINQQEWMYWLIIWWCNQFWLIKYYLSMNNWEKKTIQSLKKYPCCVVMKVTTVQTSAATEIFSGIKQLKVSSQGCWDHMIVCLCTLPFSITFTHCSSHSPSVCLHCFGNECLLP